LIENTRIDRTKIGILGFGVPALAGLHAGSKDDDVKAICCAGMPRVNPDQGAGSKGKVFLAHCKDDEVAPLDDFLVNKDVLGIGAQDYLLLEMGGHGFVSQEAVIAGYFSILIHKIFKPRYKQFTPRGVVMP
jgi:predicted esterase